MEWPKIREALGRFDPSSGEYVLVTGSLQNIPDAASLGLLPWAAVIDLDPESDQKGLQASAGPNLGKLRALQMFGKDWTSVNLAKGTAWMMAGGWKSHGELVEDDRSWDGSTRR
ncbi:MAG: hypothetical protein WB992_00760 [Bryobacteraceae bacterium]